MAEGPKGSVDSGDPPPADFVASLSDAERLLLAIREELYDGSWELMVEDLEARQGGKPYIFKLSQRIEKDIEGIRKLSDYEARNGVNLVDHL